MCDELLPNLRAGGHLNYLIKRDKSTAHCLVCRGGEVVAGATVPAGGCPNGDLTAVPRQVRGFRGVDGTGCVLDVLLMACRCARWFPLDRGASGQPAGGGSRDRAGHDCGALFCRRVQLLSRR